MKLKQFFLQIWEQREHYSEISGEPLFEPNHPMWHYQFSHVLSRGAYPKYKYNSENIVLMLPHEHILVTEHPEKAKTLPKWREYFQKYEELKEQYFKDRGI